MQAGAIIEPLLTVSPWFESRRGRYQDNLAEVSATGDWDRWITFFAEGIEASAKDTATRLRALLEVQAAYRDQLQQANVRGLARDIADLLIRDPHVTIPYVANRIGKSYQTVSNAITKLESLGILEPVAGQAMPKMFRAPAVLSATLR